ncbi:MAG: ABC transporter permease, partial [Hyphomicrobiaceae bacterium]
MTRAQIILTRLALLAVVLGAWELLPRLGAVNSLLLPPLSQVLAMLSDLVGRPNVQEAVAVTTLEVIVAFAIAVLLGAAAG